MAENGMDLVHHHVDIDAMGVVVLAVADSRLRYEVLGERLVAVRLHDLDVFLQGLLHLAGILVVVGLAVVDIAAAGGEAVEDAGQLAVGEDLGQALHAQPDVVLIALAHGEPFGGRVLWNDAVSHEDLTDVPLPRRAAGDVAALRPRLAPCRCQTRLVFRIPRAIEQMGRHEDDLPVQPVHEADSDAGDTHVDTENQLPGLGAELPARHQGRLHEPGVEAEFARVFISCHIHFLSFRGAWGTPAGNNNSIASRIGGRPYRGQDLRSNVS